MEAREPLPPIEQSAYLQEILSDLERADHPITTAVLSAIGAAPRAINSKFPKAAAIGLAVGFAALAIAITAFMGPNLFHVTGSAASAIGTAETIAGVIAATAGITVGVKSAVRLGQHLWGTDTEDLISR